MIALVRLALLIFVIELLFYGLLMIYLRSQRKEALEAEWDRRHPSVAGPGIARERFVALAMTGFNRTLKARLVRLVLVLPMVVILTIIILVNYD